MNCNYYIVDPDNHLMIKFYYSEEDLAFKYNEYIIEISDALYYKEWIIFKLEGNEAVRVSKYDFVKDLELPYTEIDVE